MLELLRENFYYDKLPDLIRSFNTEKKNIEVCDTRYLHKSGNLK